MLQIKKMLHYVVVHAQLTLTGENTLQTTVEATPLFRVLQRSSVALTGSAK